MSHKSATCPVCGSAAYLLGSLGHLHWFRCRYCGMEFSILTERPEVEPEEVEA